VAAGQLCVEGWRRVDLMAVERKWVYDRIASAGEADGCKCIFCGKVISGESQPGHWVHKAVEDYQDADFAVEDGYAHHTCTQERLSKDRQSRFTLPEVPKGPQRS
jgi:hypothetical protein